MKKIVTDKFAEEIALFNKNLNIGSFNQCWNHFERAHILGQFSWSHHFFVHWLMLKLAFRTFNSKEIFGQVPRLILAIPGSILGKAPLGNPGTSHVGIFQSMPISEELKPY